MTVTTTESYIGTEEDGQRQRGDMSLSSILKHREEMSGIEQAFPLFFAFLLTAHGFAFHQDSPSLTAYASPSYLQEVAAFTPAGWHDITRRDRMRFYPRPPICPAVHTISRLAYIQRVLRQRRHSWRTTRVEKRRAALSEEALR
jgi:hypothetical protein